MRAYKTIGTLVFRDDTDAHTYQTWWTVRVSPRGEVGWLSNREGNGQVWKQLGNATRLNGRWAFSLLNNPAGRLLACALATLGHSTYVPGGFPTRLPRGYFVYRPQLNPATGRYLTAWPSVKAVRTGRKARNKNRNREREKVARIDLGLAMAKRRTDR